MGSISRKKLLLIGVLVVLLVTIPLTIFLISQRQDVRTEAQAATTLSFEPQSSANAPIEYSQGDNITLDIYADPGEVNLIQFIELEILYDPTKISTPEAGVESIEIESGSLTLVDGPVATEGKIALTLSTGVDPSSLISTRQKIATLNLKALENTDGVPTAISFGPSTIVSSAAETDETTENVLSGALSAYINILPSSEISPSVSPEPSSPAPTNTTPTVGLSPAPTSTLSATTTVTPTGTSGTSTNISPVCLALEADRAPSGASPFSITLTARGSDQDGTISKATVSFGDGQVMDITNSGGIGSSTVAASAAHTYQNAGTYTATAVLTDSDGGVSIDNCNITITVTESTSSSQTTGTSGDGSTTTTSVAPTSVPNLPATGPDQRFIILGSIAGFITLIGAIIFLAL